jgi:hypothetical protein
MLSAQQAKRRTEILLSRLDAALIPLFPTRNMDAMTVAQLLLSTQTAELESNTQSKKSHRFQAYSHSSLPEHIYYQGNARINTTTGEIYAPYIRKVK